MRIWTRHMMSSLFLCRKLHLFLAKSTKLLPPELHFLTPICTKSCRLGLCPTLHWGLQHSPRPPLYLGGLLLKGGEGGSSSFAIGRKIKKSQRLWCLLSDRRMGLLQCHAFTLRYYEHCNLAMTCIFSHCHEFGLVIDMIVIGFVES